MSLSLDEVLLARLQARRTQNRYRQRQVVTSPMSAELSVGGRPVLCFSSNDYLALANHPEVRAAFRQAALTWGVGSGGSHLVCGHSHEHHALEEELAAFSRRPRALLFSTGYMANIGVLCGLTERGDLVCQDKLNHASLLDGGLAARATMRRYRHTDVHHLDALLGAAPQGNKFIVTDGVFSMDGNSAPLPELSSLARRHKAWLVVDDAHGIGCLGETGGGVVEQCNLGLEDVPILVGTLGKAFGTGGAFVAGSEALIEALIQFSRTYIYTTAMPPALAAATRASLRLCGQEPWRRERIRELITLFRRLATDAGLRLLPSASPIQPLWVGDDLRALQISEYLLMRGFQVVAIRPPTVPEGGARLRITLTAAHTSAQVESLVTALSECSFLSTDNAVDRPACHD